MVKISTAAYGSWESLQREKLRKMRTRVDKDMYRKIFGRSLVLDIGCGSGHLQREYDGNFIGIDIDREMLDKSMTVFPRVLGDANTLPFGNDAFDSVIAIDIMHLIKSSDFIRVLKPGGLALLAIFYNDDNYQERRDMLREKTSELRILDEFDLHTKEKEHVIIAVKSN